MKMMLLIALALVSQDPGVRIEKDVDYLGPDRKEKMDLYLPTAEAPPKGFPAVLMIHGGGWSGGDKGAAREQNIGTTLARNGYVVASVNYVLHQHVARERVALIAEAGRQEAVEVELRGIGLLGGGLVEGDDAGSQGAVGRIHPAEGLDELKGGVGAGVAAAFFDVDQPLAGRSRIGDDPVEDGVDEDAGADDQERDEEKLECADGGARRGRVRLDLGLFRDLLLELSVFGQGIPLGGGSADTILTVFKPVKSKQPPCQLRAWENSRPTVPK